MTLAEEIVEILNDNVDCEYHHREQVKRAAQAIAERLTVDEEAIRDSFLAKAYMVCKVGEFDKWVITKKDFNEFAKALSHSQIIKVRKGNDE